MKTKWAIATIFILAAVFVSTPAFAGRDGYRYNDYFGHDRYKHHFGHHRYYRHPYPFYLGAPFWSPPPPVYIYREYPETIIYRENYVYDWHQSDYPPTRNRSSSKDTSCLQAREYTTTMVIEGKTAEAYGTRCLQPDGSWRYGPAQPVLDN